MTLLNCTIHTQMEHAHIIETARRQLEMLKTLQRTGDPDDEEEDRKNGAINRLIKRQKYDEAFHVATGSSFFCVFDANIMMISFDKRLSLLAAGFFPSMRH